MGMPDGTSSNTNGGGSTQADLHVCGESMATAKNVRGTSTGQIWDYPTKTLG